MDASWKFDQDRIINTEDIRNYLIIYRWTAWRSSCNESDVGDDGQGYGEYEVPFGCPDRWYGHPNGLFEGAHEAEELQLQGAGVNIPHKLGNWVAGGWPQGLSKQTIIRKYEKVHEIPNYIFITFADRKIYNAPAAIRIDQIAEDAVARGGNCRLKITQAIAKIN